MSHAAFFPECVLAAEYRSSIGGAHEVDHDSEVHHCAKREAPRYCSASAPDPVPIPSFARDHPLEPGSCSPQYGTDEHWQVGTVVNHAATRCKATCRPRAINTRKVRSFRGRKHISVISSRSALIPTPRPARNKHRSEKELPSPELRRTTQLRPPKERTRDRLERPMQYPECTAPRAP